MTEAPLLSDMATLFIQFDRDFFITSEEVTGTVYVNIVKPIDSSRLLLRITGKEITQWVETKNNMNININKNGKSEFVCQKSLIKRGDTNLFLNKTITLLNSETTFNQSQYNIPFRMATHHKYPSSIYAIVPPEKQSSGKNEKPILSKCIVKYTACAYFLSKQQEKPLIKYKDNFIIRQLLSPICTLENKEKFKLNYSLLKCISKEGGWIEAYLDSSSVDVKGPIKLNMCIEDPKFSVCEIKMELVQKLVLRNIMNTYCAEFCEVIGRVQKPVVLKAAGKKTDNCKIDLIVDKIPYKYKYMQHDDDIMQFPSTEGCLISCNYYLKMRQKFRCCLVSCSEIIINVNLFAPIIQRKMFEPPIENWIPKNENAVVMSVDSLQVNKAFPTRLRK